MGKQISELNVVTGAFGFTGKYITQRLLALGKTVRTLTGHPDRPNPFGGQVGVAPYNFSNPKALAESLQGATTLYNTYWVRFCHGQVNFVQAVENTKTLLRAAEEAGLRKIVHLSVANASEQLALAYFRGKATAENIIQEGKLSYQIIRPTLIFGLDDILINNIAWLLRRFPVFALPGRGEYRVQPVFVEDVAEIAVQAAHQEENLVIDAAGPEIYTFGELVRMIAHAIANQARIVAVRPNLALLLSRFLSYVVHDVLLTREELLGLMENLLVSSQPPTGQTRLSHWLKQNAGQIGINYASELGRHYSQ